MDSRRTVLLADDNREINDAISEVLSEEGYDVVSVFDGRVALEWLQRKTSPPCLVLLDLMMPMMTGQEVLTEIRRDQRLKSIPVIVISASAPGRMPKEATDCLRKPFSIESLLDVVGKHCPLPEAVDCDAEQDGQREDELRP